MNLRNKCLFIALIALAGMAATAPASPSTPKSTDKPPAYELPKSGVNQARPAGGWINVEAQGTRLTVRFFDMDKKPAAPDVARGLVRLKYASKNPAHTVLVREVNLLATPATIRPPHNYLVILSLFAGDGDEAAESYTFKYP